jgi:hypothetical protein
MGAEGDSSQPRLSGGGEEEQQVVVINIRCSNGSKFTVRTSLVSPVSAFKRISIPRYACGSSFLKDKIINWIWFN